MIEIHLSQYKSNAFGCGAEGEELLSFNKILIGKRSHVTLRIVIPANFFK